MTHYRPVEPLLLHPIVRRKTESSSEIRNSRNSQQHLSSQHLQPNPYVMSHFQPFYGQQSSRQQYPMAQGLGWEDTHYRWPSPSLPPTLKKQQDHHNKKSSKFGTLDRLSPEKTLGSQGGKINYGFDSPTLERDDIRFSSTSSTNSEELVDDFGDPIKPNSKSSKGSKQSFSRTITRQSTDSEDEDDDGWTTEF
eukprot:06117.XXX_352817_351802_1 [CDS] Oithona nana genome sequencing.